MIRKVDRKNGLTLVELLVILAVVAILIGLAIPAVMMARASIRRASCANNLRQIGLALHAYEAAQGSLPTATSGAAGGARSFLVAILPYIDQRPLYDSINFQMDLYSRDVANLTANVTSVALYLSPSDGLERAYPISATNYAGNQGSGVQKFGYNGAFALLRAVRLRDIADGAAHTAAVSEWLTGHTSLLERNPLRSVVRTPVPFREPEQLELFAEACRSMDIASAPLGTAYPKGVNWFHGDFGRSLYNHVLGPNEKSCLNGTGYQDGAWTAGSYHGPGVNVLFIDGRVRFINETLDLAVWRAVASRKGGELVNLD